MAISVVSLVRKATTLGGTTVVRRGEITDRAWEQEVVSRLRYLARVTGKEPVGVEDPRELLLEQFLVHVELPGEGLARFPVFKRSVRSSIVCS